MATEIIKTASAVLMPPVKPIPGGGSLEACQTWINTRHALVLVLLLRSMPLCLSDADQFIPDVNQPNCVALRRCPGNRFVTLFGTCDDQWAGENSQSNHVSWKPKCWTHCDKPRDLRPTAQRYSSSMPGSTGSSLVIKC